MKKQIYILGIYTGHNATASLLKDGEIIACVSEERFNGVKNYIGYPKKSIEWCLDFAKITPRDLAIVAFPSTFGAPIFVSDETKKTVSIILLAFFYQIAGRVRKLWGKLVFLYPKIRRIGSFCYMVAAKTMGQYVLIKEKQNIAKDIGVSVEKIITFDHHLSHAATAYYASPFSREKALVLTLDAEGNLVCSTVHVFQKDSNKKLASTSRENSLGWMYLYLTKYLGMKPGEHEYKVMGLAPYAKIKDVQKVFEKIKDIIILDPKNKLKFYARFNMQDMYEYLKKNMEGVRFDIVAGAFQKLLEDRIVEWVTYAIQRTKIATIICSGGVFMNVKANQKVSLIPQVKRAYFMPSAGDESVGIGACYVAYIDLLHSQNRRPEPKSIKDLYLGPSFSNADVEQFLKKGKYEKKYTINKIDNIEKEIAQLLAHGKVVGRVNGRMEWGARSLGNRSILADPSNIDAVFVINKQMKDRDFWMPFAPTIMLERMHDYCVNPKNIAAYYMILSFDSTSLARKELRAALHPYDFTLRPQILEEAWNPKYYKLIKEFEKLTGIGGVLNTSFNLHGMPVVLGPKEAMYAFEHSGLEYVALENFLISK